MTNEQLRDKAEHFVLSTYLSDWNGDLPFSKILEGIADEDWNIATPWEPFETMEGKELANNVADSVNYFIQLFKDEVSQ